MDILVQSMNNPGEGMEGEGAVSSILLALIFVIVVGLFDIGGRFQRVLGELWRQSKYGDRG